uniref:Uncharacterized protein n=1 Tax=Anguilla anguilla TaxID=7936 RepID=A0A0E9XY48_ANGAN
MTIGRSEASKMSSYQILESSRLFKKAVDLVYVNF